MESEIRQLMQEGNWQEALVLAESFRQQEESASSLVLFSSALSALGRNEEALPIAEEAYQMTRGSSDRIALESVNNMARFSFRAQDYDRAVALGREALLLFQSVFGGDHQATLRVMENLSRYEMATGDLESALATVQEALDIWGDQDDSEVALSLLLTSMEILNRLALSRFIAFYGTEAAIIKKVKGRLGIED